MIFVLIAICAYSFCIGRIVGDSLKPPDGILVGSSSALFFIYSQFVVDVSADVRPDQLATLCVSAAIFSFINVSGDATARRRAFTGFFFCGILLATSILFTQKSLFVLPGIFLSSVFYLFVKREKFFARLSKVMMMVLGFILPIALMVGYFFSQDAFDNFIYYNFTINAKWPIEMPLWAVGGKLILRNPEFILGSLAGSAILIRQILLWHAATPLPIIVVAASLTSYLIGLLIIPIAQRQYYFQIIPLMAIVVSVGWVHGVRFIFRSGRAFMAASIGLLVFLSAVSVLQFGIRLYRHDVPRFNSIRVVLERTRPDDVVINGFRSQVLFRRSASYFAYLDGETCALMARDQHLQSLMGRLIDDVLTRRIQPAVITYEPQDCPMMEQIQDFLYQYYEPVERSFFWIRKQ